jgi:hypothetical protein
VSDAQRQAFDERLSHDEHFLTRGLAALLNYPGLITSPTCRRPFARAEGAHAACRSASGTAAGGYRLDVALSHVEKQRLTGGELNHKLGHYFRDQPER